MARRRPVRLTQYGAYGLPHYPPEQQVQRAFLYLLYCLAPSSLALKPLPSHILRFHFIPLQITMGDLYHSAPCHRRGPRFAVCLLYSGSSDPSPVSPRGSTDLHP